MHICSFICSFALHFDFWSCSIFVTHEILSIWFQKIQYAKTKSDVVAKADGTFVPREKRKRNDEKRKIPVNVHAFTFAVLLWPLGTLSWFALLYFVWTRSLPFVSTVCSIYFVKLNWKMCWRWTLLHVAMDCCL